MSPDMARQRPPCSSLRAEEMVPMMRAQRVEQTCLLAGGVHRVDSGFQVLGSTAKLPLAGVSHKDYAAENQIEPRQLFFFFVTFIQRLIGVGKIKICEIEFVVLYSPCPSPTQK